MQVGVRHDAPPSPFALRPPAAACSCRSTVPALTPDTLRTSPGLHFLHALTSSHTWVMRSSRCEPVASSECSCSSVTGSAGAAGAAAAAAGAAGAAGASAAAGAGAGAAASAAGAGAGAAGAGAAATAGCRHAGSAGGQRTVESVVARTALQQSVLCVGHKPLPASPPIGKLASSRGLRRRANPGTCAADPKPQRQSAVHTCAAGASGLGSAFFCGRIPRTAAQNLATSLPAMNAALRYQEGHAGPASR